MATRFSAPAVCFGADAQPARSARAMIPTMPFISNPPPVSSDARSREQGRGERCASIDTLQWVGQERQTAHRAEAQVEVSRVEHVAGVAGRDLPDREHLFGAGVSLGEELVLLDPLGAREDRVAVADA